MHISMQARALGIPRRSTFPQLANLIRGSTDQAVLDGAAAGEELNAEHDERKNQHDVDVGAEGVEADPTQKPEHQENYE